MDNKKYKRNIYVASVLIVILIVISILLVYLGIGMDTSGGNGSKATTQEDQGAVEEPQQTDKLRKSNQKVKGFVTGVNVATGKITIFSTETGKEVSFTYSGGANIKNTYGKAIASSMLKIGDFYEAEYSSDQILVEMNGISDTWKYENILNLAIDDVKQRILVGETIYRYDDSLHILDGDSFVTLKDISSKDVFSLYGMGEYAYILKVVRGHGKLSFANSDAFIGGTVILNGNQEGQLEKDTEYTLAEGTYGVVVSAGDLSAVGDITMTAHGDVVFDLAPFTPEPPKMGEVVFMVSPNGAVLFIDGIKTSYSDPVMLTYGKHTVEAELGGYVSLSGTINVEKERTGLKLTLPPSTDAVLPDENGETADTPENTAEENTENETGETVENTEPDEEAEPEDFDDDTEEEEPIVNGGQTPQVIMPEDPESYWNSDWDNMVPRYDFDDEFWDDESELLNEIPDSEIDDED